MKRTFSIVGLFALGGAAAAACDALLFSLWDWLGVREPVQDWLISLDHSWLAARWNLVWVSIPNWVGAALLGAVLGCFLKRKRWVSSALVSAAGFVFIPQIVFLLSVWEYFDFRVGAMVICWDLVAVPLLLGAAWLTSRRFHPAVIADTGSNAEG